MTANISTVKRAQLYKSLSIKYSSKIKARATRAASAGLKPNTKRLDDGLLILRHRASGKTLREVGVIMGLSPSRIRQKQEHIEVAIRVALKDIEDLRS